MRHKMVNLAALSLLTFLLLAATARANRGAGVRLSAERLNLGTGNQTTVDILADDVPSVYGVDVRLRFDPAQLEVVDSDASTPGIQLAHGDFIDPAQSFILQNRADNVAGTIDYALTLLHPAAPAQGDGILARITFRAKVDGWTTVSLEQALFGTQTGQTIPRAPIPVQAGFTASDTEGMAPLVVMFTNTSTGDYTTSGWDFGNGTTSSLANPTHTYTRAGRYSIKLTITAASGDESSALLVITINSATPTPTLTPTPMATPSPTPNKICLPLIIKGQSNTPVVNAAYSFQSWLQGLLARLFNQH